MAAGRCEADADVDGVVGGDVGVAAAPAVTAAVRRQVAPQQGDPYAAAWLVPYLPVSWLL